MKVITLFEFSLNVFLEFAEFSDKHIVITAKGFKPAISCVRDQNATTAPTRHLWETESLNWLQFMLQWFIRIDEFAEFRLHLGKTPLYIKFCTNLCNQFFFENYCQKSKKKNNESITHLLKTLFIEAWICSFEPSSVITDWHFSKELVGFTGTRCSGSRRLILCLSCVQTCSYTQITCQNIAIWCLPSQMRWLNRNQEMENNIFTWTFVLVSRMEDKCL